MFSFNIIDESIIIEKRTSNQSHVDHPGYCIYCEHLFQLFMNISHCGSITESRIFTDSGTQDAYLIENMPGFGQRRISRKHTFLGSCDKNLQNYNGFECTMIVHKHNNGQQLKFVELEGGLYFYYQVKPTTYQQLIYDYFATTVAENKLLLRKGKVDQADFVADINSF